MISDDVRTAYLNHYHRLKGIVDNSVTLPDEITNYAYTIYYNYEKVILNGRPEDLEALLLNNYKLEMSLQRTDVTLDDNQRRKVETVLDVVKRSQQEQINLSMLRVNMQKCHDAARGNIPTEGGHNPAQDGPAQS